MVMRDAVVLQALLLIHISVACFFTAVSCQSDSSSSVVVAGYDVSGPAGSNLVLQCMSGRMVWTRDRVRDRQRVVHWDMYRDAPDYAMERVVDMFSAGDQRLYHTHNLGRVSLNPTAFKDGNFSLVIKDVKMNDRGLYSCNLHHIYCHLHETVRVQLNVTKSKRKQDRFWDGQKAVYVVLQGTTAVLPCINRRSVWTDWSDEEEDQQVVHWDRQSPGVQHDSADRLVDLYASGEQRSYGPLFLQRKMNISNKAFSEGDFSLTITDLQKRGEEPDAENRCLVSTPPALSPQLPFIVVTNKEFTDQGTYSCHLHHHYCGLHERREFRVSVEAPLIWSTQPVVALPRDKDASKADAPRVINVILPDQKHHFLLPLGYILASFLLLAFIALIVVLVTKRRKARDFSPKVSVRSSRSPSSSDEYEIDIGEMNACTQEEKGFEYKNNLLKENALMKAQPKVIDLDKEIQKFSK